MKVLSIQNRKGGAAKTTSVLNLAAEFSSRGQRVLVVDTDPQGILTLLANIDAESVEHEQSLMAAILPESYSFDADAIAHPAPWGGEIWPASVDLSGAEIVLAGPEAAGSTKRLGVALAEVADRYDLVLLDTPPSASKLAYNCLMASDAVLVPAPADYVSTGGLLRFLRTLENVRRLEKPDLRLLGIFFSLWRHTVHSRETMDSVRGLLGDQVFSTAIPQTVAIQDAQSEHMALRQLAPEDPAAQAYRALADEISERLEPEIVVRQISEAPAEEEAIVHG